MANKANKKKIEKRVVVKVTYECGRCGNVQRREYESVDGLITVPNVYCGWCMRGKNFSLMTSTVTDGMVGETTDEPGTGERTVKDGEADATDSASTRVDTEEGS